MYRVWPAGANRPFSLVALLVSLIITEQTEVRQRQWQRKTALTFPVEAGII